MRFLFATGGTAGHINPALAVASYLKEKYPQCKILFVGTPDHMEASLVPKAGFDFKTIEINGFKRSFTPKAVLDNVKTVGKLLKAEKQSKKIINDFKPDVIIGFGGYVSGPVLEEAVKLGIPSCIHEQNAYPGITNKQLAKSVDKVMLAVEDAKKHLDSKNEPIVTGLPVRGELLKKDKAQARKELNIPDGKNLVLSFGGSLGAAPINDAMRGILVENSKTDGNYYIHSAGTNGADFIKSLEDEGFKTVKDGVVRRGNVEVRRYIDNMDVCMAAADVVISRAGASSVCEIEALGKASILIPSPYVAENHQYYNAMALVKRNAAKIIEEKDLTEDSLKNSINEYLNSDTLIEETQKNAKSMAVLDSCERIAEVIIYLLK